MPNGVTGSSLVRREDLELMLCEVLHEVPAGSSLRLGQRLSSKISVPVDVAEVVALLRAFSGREIWVQEHGDAAFIIHLDQELEGRGAVDGEKWILVDGTSPLFEPLRQHSKAYHTWNRWLMRGVRRFVGELVRRP